MHSLFRPSAGRPDSASDDQALTPFDVVDANAILAILRSLQRRRALLSVHPPGSDATVITQVLDVNAQQLTLDYASHAEGNRLLARAGGARIEGRDVDVPIAFFIDTPTSCTYDGRLALAVALPRLVRRFQRREYFRVHVPLGRPAFCLLPAKGEALQVRARVVDVSCGGLALVGEPELRSWTEGEIRDGELRLPSQHPLAVTLQAVRFIRSQVQHAPYLGCRFVGLAGRPLTIVQRYVHELQRDALRRAS